MGGNNSRGVNSVQETVSLEYHLRSSAFINFLTVEILHDQQVWDVVARWHGLVLLYKLYFHPGINWSYRKSISLYPRSFDGNYLRSGDCCLKTQ